MPDSVLLQEQSETVYDYLGNPEERPFLDIQEGVFDILQEQSLRLAVIDFTLPKDGRDPGEIDTNLTIEDLADEVDTDAFALACVLSKGYAYIVVGGDEFNAHERARRARALEGNGEPTALDIYIQSLNELSYVFGQSKILPADQKNLIQLAQLLCGFELERLQTTDLEWLTSVMRSTESYSKIYSSLGHYIEGLAGNVIEWFNGLIG